MAVDFTYAVARLRAIEAAMPDRAWFMRMVRSPARQLLAGVREHYPGFEGVDALHDFERRDRGMPVESVIEVIPLWDQQPMIPARCLFRLELAHTDLVRSVEVVTSQVGQHQAGRHAGHHEHHPVAAG